MCNMVERVSITLIINIYIYIIKIHMRYNPLYPYLNIYI